VTLLERQRLYFRDQFRSFHREEFESWFATLARGLHPAGDFQSVRLTQGDSGIDGFSIAAQTVYQVFAPARMDETRDAETAEKITSDFAKALAALQSRMQVWIFVHNHPEGKLGKLGIAAIAELKASHPAIRIEVWNIEILWEQIARLPVTARRTLFPSISDVVEATDGTTQIREALAARGDFAVPALDLRLPLSEAWDRLHLLPTTETSSPAGGTAPLDREIQRYYEWARLARTDRSRDFPATDLLDSGKRTIIVAGPGSGKSTLARKLAWSAATRGQSVWRVSLRAVARLVERGTPIQEALQLNALQEASVYAQHAMTCSPPAALIADGLDEADPNRLVVAEALRDWALANPNVAVIITTRPIGHTPGILPEFASAELLPLAPKVIAKFARSMLEARKAKSEETEEFLASVQPRSRLRHKKDHATATIASRSPLLLSFLVALHLDGQAIQGPRAELYAAMLDLCQRGSDHGRIVKSNIPAAALHRGLDALAWAAFENPGMERNAQLEVVSAETNNQPSSSWDASDLAAFWIERKVLEVIRLGQRETLVFIHPTLAEFCAARHLQRLDPSKRISWLATNRRSAAARETILLACGCGGTDWIVPKLLELDSDDVCATEAILAAACLAETASASTQFLPEVARRIAQRLVSAVPLVSVEAAESLSVVAPVAGPVLHDACRPHYAHVQPWTRLGARALGLASKDPALSPAAVAGWLTPSHDGLTPGWTHWPDGSLAVRAQLVELGFEKLFSELPLADARRVAEEFMTDRHHSVLEADLLAEVCLRHGCPDLLAQHHAHFLRSIAKFSPADIEAAADAQMQALLELILFGTGLPRSPGHPPPGFAAPKLGEFLDALDFWEMPITAFVDLDDSEHVDVAIETIRGALAASGVETEILAAETTLLLGIKQGLSKVLFEVVPQGNGRPAEWSRAKVSRLESSKLLRALLHPSALIKVVAANLLGAGAGGDVSLELAWEVLRRSQGDGLYYVAGIASALWPDTKTEVLLRRLELEPEAGLEHVCQELGKNVPLNHDAIVRERLLAKLLNGSAIVAKGAAEGLFALGAAAPQGYADKLRQAFSHWMNAELKCEKCGAVLREGHCPECHVIPPTPHGGLVRCLAAIGAISEAEMVALSRNDWHSVRDAAVDVLAKRAAQDRECLKRLLSGSSHGSSGLIGALLKLPNAILADCLEEVLALRSATGPDIRLTFMAALASLPLAAEMKEAIAREGLADMHPPVRDAAARLLRVQSA
jgi:hypothetical protein